MTEAIQTFFAGWGDADADARKRHLERVLEPHFAYADPHAAERVQGVAAMSDFLGHFTHRMPQASAKLVHIDSHNGFHRATVDFMKNAETRMMRGQYFIETSNDGRLVRAVGFVGMGDPE